MQHSKLTGFPAIARKFILENYWEGQPFTSTVLRPLAVKNKYSAESVSSALKSLGRKTHHLHHQRPRSGQRRQIAGTSLDEKTNPLRVRIDGGVRCDDAPEDGGMTKRGNE